MAHAARAGLLLLAIAAGCAGWRPPTRGLSPLDAIARTLRQRADGESPEYDAIVRGLLENNLMKDAYRCTPAGALVLASPPPGTEQRTIRGAMPHYGVYHGPMMYRVGRERAEDGRRRWTVMLNVALVTPAFEGEMEMPDCAGRSALEGSLRCEGTPYEQAPGLEACPDSGHFEAPFTRRNAQALLTRWSREVEAHYNRDAIRFGIPVRYDFHFFLQDDHGAAREPVDVRLPLSTSCGRTPYFEGLRSGWSVSILAHEMGHFLGLLDEYEALSGISDLYPKTPFAGADGSRMAVSMKPHTRFFPLHHYLVLRRYHCDEPGPLERDPYQQLLQP